MIPAARTARTNRTNRTNRTTSTARRIALTLAGLGVVLSVSACGIRFPEVAVDPGTDPAEQPATSVTTSDTTSDTTPDTTPGTTVPDDGRINPTSPPVLLPDYQTTVPVEQPEPVEDPVEEPVEEPVVVPAGALDLGNGVFVEAAGAWTGSMDGTVASLTDGTLTAQIQLVTRPAGEHPGVVLGEYLALFEDEFDAVSFSPARLVWSTTDPRPVEMYTVFYSSFDPAAEYGRGLDGGITLLVRDDGLTLITDVWGPADAAGSLPDATWNGVFDRFLAAAEVADPVALTPIDDFRVETAGAPVLVDGLAGFTLAPGFELVEESDGIAVVSNGANEFAVAAPSAAEGIDEFMQRTVDFAVSEGAETFDEIVEHGDNGFGVEHRELTWTGTCNGQSCGGAIDVFVDANSGRAFLLASRWLWNPADGSRPDAAAHRFMYHSMVQSFEDIPA